MSAAARTIMTQIRTQLAEIDGAGGYVHDVSATGRIVFGFPVSPDGPPRIYIADLAIESSHDHNLGAYDRRLSCLLMAFVGAASDSTEARMLAALDMADDIATALEADRTLGGNVLDLIVNIQAIDGDELEYQGLGIAQVLLTGNYIAQSGVGL